MAKPKAVVFDPSRLLVLAKIRDEKRAISRDLYNRNLELQEQKREITEKIRSRGRVVAASGLGMWTEIANPQDIDEENKHRLNVRQAEIVHLISENQKERDLANAQMGAAGQLLTACFAFAKQAGLTIPYFLRGEADA